jgi:hypothetical protein
MLLRRDDIPSNSHAGVIGVTSRWIAVDAIGVELATIWGTITTAKGGVIRVTNTGPARLTSEGLACGFTWLVLNATTRSVTESFTYLGLHWSNHKYLPRWRCLLAATHCAVAEAETASV